MNLTIDSASFQGNMITASGTALQTFSLSLLRNGTVVQGPVNVTPLAGKWSQPFNNCTDNSYTLSATGGGKGPITRDVNR
jgi:hypothetical protein